MVLRVKVLNYDTIIVKPKLDKEVLQYVILTEDEWAHSEVFFIDVDKFDKAKFTELVKQKYASRYRIPASDVEVSFLVEPTTS